MPGGVNSPVRAFRSVGAAHPIFFKSAKGSKLYDVDGNEYIDYIGSWGPMIHGHADPDIEAAAIEALKNSSSFGAPTELENLMAAEVIKLVPSIEMVRMVNSGTEAVLSAIRLARAFTAKLNPKKNKIIKFKGCYHGHVDALLVQAGSGVATLGLPDSLGVNSNVTQDTIVLNFNDFSSLEEAFRREGELISAIIVEPIIGNGGCILPEAGFLEALRAVCDKYESLLIFDEVMTGFRVALGGAQEKYSVMPDITTLGKVIGGGFPVGAYGARREIMELVAPAGAMYQAGTLSGNPVAMAAGLTALKKLQRAGFYDDLTAKAQYLIKGLKAASADIPVQFVEAAGMFGMFFSKTAVKDFDEAKASNVEFFKKYYMEMLKRGIYLAPSAFEAFFMSAAHSYEDLDRTIEAHKSSILFLNQVLV
jgi:glutamate-1-semialdehyde 2,1-aminomutase